MATSFTSVAIPTSFRRNVLSFRPAASCHPGTLAVSQLTYPPSFLSKVFSFRSDASCHSATSALSHLAYHPSFRRNVFSFRSDASCHSSTSALSHLTYTNSEGVDTPQLLSLRPSVAMCYRSVPMLVIQARLHCRTSHTRILMEYKRARKGEGGSSRAGSAKLIR